MTTFGHTLTFMGTGASCGVPAFYCGCKACQEARVDPRAARDCSGLMIVGQQYTLIDAAPELRIQLIREGVSSIDRLLFTHEHFDHIGGLPQLEFYVRLKTKTPVPVYGGAQTIAAIKQQYAFMLDTLDIHTIESFETLDFDGVRYTALPAAHNEGCFGYLIEKETVTERQGTMRQGDGSLMRQGDGSLVSSVSSPSSSRMAYFPDTGPLPLQTLECLYDLDTLIIDSTFSGANWMPKKHHSIDEAIALAEQLGPKQTYLTHLAMHFDEPITLKELTDRLSVYNGAISVAYDGLRISF